MTPHPVGGGIRNYYLNQCCQKNWGTWILLDVRTFIGQMAGSPDLERVDKRSV
jgi:hypothetical protein